MNATPSRGRADFLLPAPLRGSGGHRTAVLAGESLAAAGFDVHLHFRAAPGVSAKKTRSRAALWHGPRRCEVHAGLPDALPQSDVLIATNWRSAVAATQVRTNALRMHFVQDYEAWFHPMGEQYLAAAGVHDVGLQSIVIGNWLQHQLLDHHGLPSWSIPFTADLAAYRPRPLGGEGSRTVLAMYQPDKPRRCAGLMRAALARLLDTDERARVVTLGSQSDPKLGSRHVHLGLLPRTELPAAYARATVGLSVSSSNPSRVPFEMMATGLPVVEIGRENTVFDFPDEGCLLAHPDPESLAKALRDVLADADLRAQLADGGRRFMAQRPETAEGEAFIAAVDAALEGNEAPGLSPQPRYRAQIVRGGQVAAWDVGPTPGGGLGSRWIRAARTVQRRLSGLRSGG